MKKQLSLNVPKPCSENWSSFTQTQNGGFCISCTKVVIDFARMDDDEIIKFFNKQPGNTCGRFKPDQLKSYLPISSPTVKPGFVLLKAGAISLLMLLICKQGSSQDIIGKAKTELVSGRQLKKEKSKHIDINKEHIVKGIVMGEDGLSVPGAIVVLKNTDIGTTADADGNFEFPRKLYDGDVLVVSFIGYETTEHKISGQSSEIIQINLTLDFVVMGEVAIDQVYEENPSGFHKLMGRIKQWF
jgi:hypothetical protein